MMYVMEFLKLSVFLCCFILTCAKSINSNEKNHEYVQNSNDSRSINTQSPRFNNTNFQQTVEVLEGKPLVLNCTATGIPQPNITWFKNNRNFGNSCNTKQDNCWTINKAQLHSNDIGNYTCIVQNESGKINRTFYVTKAPEKPGLGVPAKIIQPPENTTRNVGQNVTFFCKFKNTDLYKENKYTIMWVRTSQNCTPELAKSLVNNKTYNHTLSKAEKLELTTVSKQSEGWYTCIAHTFKPSDFASAYLKINDAGDPKHYKIISVAVGLVLCLIFVFAAAYCIIRGSRKKGKRPTTLELEDEPIYDKKVIIKKPQDSGHSTISDTFVWKSVQVEIRDYENRNQTNRGFAGNIKYKMPPADSWEFPRLKVVLDQLIGEGEFGEVYKAHARGIIHPHVSTIVAVKKLKTNHNDADMKNLVSELEIMKMIGKHDNIISLLGCCSQRGDLLVITEFASRGDLLTYLREFSQPSRGPGSSYVENRPNEIELIKFGHQVAKGMEFLASKKCVHRDLAARNILVDENFVLKIADFGLARNMDDKNYYTRNTKHVKLPYKWMAPEVFTYNKYTIKSDVWSYAILLWEIMTLGAIPYPEIRDYTKLYKKLLEGVRMQKPPNCPEPIYSLMEACWNYDSNHRPTFTQIRIFLQDVIAIYEGRMSTNDLYFTPAYGLADEYSEVFDQISSSP